MRLLKAGVAAILMLMSPAAQASDISWQDSSGTTQSLADYRGKPVVLHFWASWCPPCRTEMPGLQAWIKANPDITFIPVTLDNDIDDAVAFLEAGGLSLPALRASTAEATRFGVRGLPTTVVINGDGTVVSRKTGAVAWEDTEAVAPLMQAYRAE